MPVGISQIDLLAGSHLSWLGFKSTGCFNRNGSYIIQEAEKAVAPGGAGTIGFVLMENTPDTLPDDFSGLDGLDFRAKEDQTYVINSRIENGRAKVWIEDSGGTVVSDVVTGFGDVATEMRGTFGAMLETNFDMLTDLDAENVPDPNKGWGLLTNLPPPPYQPGE